MLFPSCLGEWWGSKDKEPIFALHGWQDNARTWDPLLRLLPEDYSVLAIDLPGHGVSSHFPEFINYSFLHYPYVLRRLQNYYSLKDIIILGHSGGSAAGFLYSSIFPDSVRGYFGIDFLLYAYKEEEKRVNKMAEIVDLKIKFGLRDHNMSPAYDWDVAKEVIIGAMKGSVNSNTAEILMKRGMSKKSDGKYIFNRDGRIKTEALESISVKQAETLSSNIKAHTRLVKGTKSPFFDKGIKNCPHILDTIKRSVKSYELHSVEGGRHHLHMDVPEVILPILVGMLKIL